MIYLILYSHSHNLTDTCTKSRTPIPTTTIPAINLPNQTTNKQTTHLSLFHIIVILGILFLRIYRFMSGKGDTIIFPSTASLEHYIPHQQGRTHCSTFTQLRGPGLSRKCCRALPEADAKANMWSLSSMLFECLGFLLCFCFFLPLPFFAPNFLFLSLPFFAPHFRYHYTLILFIYYSSKKKHSEVHIYFFLFQVLNSWNWNCYRIRHFFLMELPSEKELKKACGQMFL